MTAFYDQTCFPGLARRDSDGDIALPPRLIDLAQSFPLLFYMLASDSGAFARRLEAIRLVQSGHSLHDVAAVYQLPLSLRRIRPEACVSPLPWFGWSREAGPQLANHVPASASEVANWLAAVFHGARSCNEEFGLWMARQQALFVGPTLDCRLLLPLALYAWHSTQPDTPLQCITTVPWSPRLGLPRALDEADAWLSRLQMLAQCGSYPIEDTWFAAGQVGGYEFVPIVSWDQLMSERIVMRNCLHTYVDKLANGGCRLFAVKSGANSVATLEISGDRFGALAIVQLKGPGNARVTPEIAAAAAAWAEGQRSRRRPSWRTNMSPRGATRLQHLLAAYWETTGATQACPTVATMKEQLNQIRLRLLAARNQPLHVADSARRRRAIPPQGPMLAAESQRIHAALRASLGDDVHGNWFGSLELHGCLDGVVHASVPVRFLQRWIEVHYTRELTAACSLVWGEIDRVEVTVRPAVPIVAAPPPAAYAAAPVRAVPPACAAPAHHEPAVFDRPVAIDDIIAALTRQFGVSRQDILSDRRHRSVVLPRQVGMYLARQLSRRGLPEIGRRFGDRDHTTVLHAVRKIDRLLMTDPHLQNDIDDLRRDLSLRVAAQH